MFFTHVRLKPQKMENGTLEDIGFVGEAIGITADKVRAAVHDEIVLVISPIGATEDGTVLNINAGHCGRRSRSLLTDTGAELFSSLNRTLTSLGKFCAS